LFLYWRDCIRTGVGQSGQYKRGFNESGSLFTWFSSGARTVTAVPTTRITSAYFLERRPALGSFLLTDGENEVTYIAWKLPTKRVADTYDRTPSNLSSTW
jgi:hypothetical protein